MGFPIARLLEAFAVGGANLGQRMDARTEAANKEATDKADREAKRAETAALMQHYALENQGLADPTRYAEFQGRKYDMRDPTQAATYRMATTEAPQWDVQSDGNGGFVRINKKTGEGAPVSGLESVKPPKPPRTGFNPLSGDLVNMDNGAPIASMSPGGVHGIQKLPTNAQDAITSMSSLGDSLDNYEQLASDYLKRPAMDRAAGMMGAPDPKRDAALGNLKAAQSSLQIQLKQLAGLGALSESDFGLMNSFLGDPNDLSSLVRDPQYTLARIGQARRLLESKRKAYEDTYGVKLPRGSSSSAPPATAPVTSGAPVTPATSSAPPVQETPGERIRRLARTQKGD